MPSLRFLTDNAVSRSTLSCTVTNASYPITQLAKHTKSDFWRTTATTAQIIATFANAETVSCVAIPINNFTSGATLRVRLYSDVGGTILLLDSASAACIPAREFPPANEILGSAGFQFGFGRYATRYFTQPANVRHIKIDIVDAGNTQGFLEVSFLVIGKYYALEHNFSLGATISWKSGTQLSNNDAGDNLVMPSWKRKAITFDLSSASSSERNGFFNIFLGNGAEYPIFVSCFPADASLEKEEQFTIYGRLASESEQKLVTCTRFTTSIQVNSL